MQNEVRRKLKDKIKKDYAINKDIIEGVDSIEDSDNVESDELEHSVVKKLLFEEFVELSDDYYSLAFYGFFLNCSNERELTEVDPKNYDEIMEIIGEDDEHNQNEQPIDQQAIDVEIIMRKTRNKKNFFRILLIFVF